jgi:hypothetical protein
MMRILRVVRYMFIEYLLALRFCGTHQHLFLVFNSTQLNILNQMTEINTHTESRHDDVLNVTSMVKILNLLVHSFNIVHQILEHHLYYVTRLHRKRHGTAST